MRGAGGRGLRGGSEGAGCPSSTHSAEDTAASSLVDGRYGAWGGEGAGTAADPSAGYMLTPWQP